MPLKILIRTRENNFTKLWTLCNYDERAEIQKIILNAMDEQQLIIVPEYVFFIVWNSHWF